MMARGSIARPGASTLPTFSGRLTKATGENEQVEIAFTAETSHELMERLAAAGVAASARLVTNNETILRAGESFEARQRKIYDAAVGQIRAEVAGMTSERRPGDDPEPDEPGDEECPDQPGDDAPADGDEPAKEDTSSADVAARAVHAPANP
jgi:hypothetical protein